MLSYLKITIKEKLVNCLCVYLQFSETWVPDSSSKDRDDADTIVQCTNLLLNLCESSGKTATQ